MPDALSQLRDDRTAFLAALDALTPAQRAFHPAEGAWSADGIAEHVARSEGGLLRLIERHLAAGDERADLGPPAPESVLDAVEARMRSDSRWAMPSAAAQFIAPTGSPADQTRAYLDGFDARWQSLSDSLPPELDGAAIVAHPAAGPVTLDGAARFSACHLDHHRRQIDRLRTAEGFPNA